MSHNPLIVLEPSVLVCVAVVCGQYIDLSPSNADLVEVDG